MLGLYYRIWVDAITSTRKSRGEATSWKAYTLVPLSLLMGVNLFTFFLWMKTLVNKRLPLFFNITIFNANLINDYISIIVTLFLPFLILNYLLIFSNNQYENLLKEYTPQSGKLYKRYALISIGVLLIPVIVGLMFF